MTTVGWRKRVALAFLVLFCFEHAFGCSKLVQLSPKRLSPRERGRSLTVTTYNPRWLFIPPYGRHSTTPIQCPWPDPTVAREHIKNAARVIDSIQGDIYVIPEVQDLCVLEELRLYMEDGEQYGAFLIEGKDTYTGMNVGLLSKINPTLPLRRISMSTKVICDDPRAPKFTGVSRNFVAHFAVEDYTDEPINFVLYGVHLTAFPGNHIRTAVREAQARIVAKDIAKEVENGYHVIVAGDINDFDYTLGNCQTTGKNQTLSILRCAGPRLNNTATLIPDDQRYSTTRRTLIDHILTDSRLSFKNAKIHHGNGASYFDSDHYPVSVEVTF